MNPNIDAITLGVTDLSRSLEFYERGFGFPARDRAPRATLDLGSGGGSGTLELCPWEELAADAGVSPQSSGFRGFTLSYIVEQAPDVDDMLLRLEHAGGVVSKPPRLAFWGYSAHVTDPSGHLWKIASPKRRSLIARKRAANGIPDPVPAQEIALTIGVADIKRARRFYEDGLGNPTQKAYSKFVSFDGGGGTADLALYTWDALADDADVAPAGSGFRGFRVSHVAESTETVEALLARADAAGGEVRGGDYFTDLDGVLWKIAARV